MEDMDIIQGIFIIINIKIIQMVKSRMMGKVMGIIINNLEGGRRRKGKKEGIPKEKRMRRIMQRNRKRRNKQGMLMLRRRNMQQIQLIMNRQMTINQ